MDHPSLLEWNVLVGAGFVGLMWALAKLKRRKR